MAYHYVWLIWSSAFLLPWLLLYALFPQHRVPMWRSSLVMAPFGLTEPPFVPALESAKLQHPRGSRDKNAWKRPPILDVARFPTMTFAMRLSKET